MLTLNVFAEQIKPKLLKHIHKIMWLILQLEFETSWHCLTRFICYHIVKMQLSLRRWMLSSYLRAKYPIAERFPVGAHSFSFRIYIFFVLVFFLHVIFLNNAHWLIDNWLLLIDLYIYIYGMIHGLKNGLIRKKNCCLKKTRRFDILWFCRISYHLLFVLLSQSNLKAKHSKITFRTFSCLRRFSPRCATSNLQWLTVRRAIAAAVSLWNHCYK